MKNLKRFNESEGENTKRFVGPDGGFKPTYQPKKGTMTIGYLEELLEWLYYHDNITDEEKMQNILNIEKMIQDLLNGKGGRSMVSGGITYRPTWSKRLKKDLGIGE